MNGHAGAAMVRGFGNFDDELRLKLLLERLAVGCDGPAFAEGVLSVALLVMAAGDFLCVSKHAGDDRRRIAAGDTPLSNYHTPERIRALVLGVAAGWRHTGTSDFCRGADHARESLAGFLGG